MYRTREQAAMLAGRSPGLGRFVAELVIPLDGEFKLELDNGSDGHCTVWGAPEALRSLVTTVQLALYRVD